MEGFKPKVESGGDQEKVTMDTLSNMDISEGSTVSWTEDGFPQEVVVTEVGMNTAEDGTKYTYFAHEKNGAHTEVRVDNVDDLEKFFVNT